MKSPAGSVLGAVAGGVIGSSVRRGAWPRCRRRSSARWAVATPVIRSRAKCRQETLTPRLSKRCKTVYDKSEKMLGYDVTYKIGDQQGKIRMDKDPGTQIPLDDNGQLILNNKA